MDTRRCLGVLIFLVCVGLLCALIFVVEQLDPDVAGDFFGVDGFLFLALAGLLLPLALVVAFDARARAALQRMFSPRGLANEHNDAGVQYFERGGYVAAVAEFSEAIRLNPHLPAAYINRAACHCEHGKLDDALADLNEAIRLGPTHADGFSWRGHVWYRKGDIDKALTDLESALRLDRGHVGARLHRAEILIQRGEADAALADVDEVFLRQPNCPEVYIARGGIWLLKRDYDRAIHDLSEVLRRGLPPTAGLFRDRGLAWYFKGDYERALDDLNESLRRDPEDGLAYNNRGAAYLKRGAYAWARADLEAAIRLLPQLANPYKHLAWLLATCPEPTYRDGARAVQLAQKALDIVGDKMPEWFGVLAAAHAEAGNFDEAIAWQERCIDKVGPELKQEMTGRLELYEKGMVYRERKVTSDVRPS